LGPEIPTLAEQPVCYLLDPERGNSDGAGAAAVASDEVVDRQDPIRRVLDLEREERGHRGGGWRLGLQVREEWFFMREIGRGVFVLGKSNFWD
jgi:hypothetical protein